jgi:hypothetical protein
LVAITRPSGYGWSASAIRFSLHLRAVRVGRVDQVDAQLQNAPEEALRLLRIGGRAPDALPGDPHGAKPEAVDLEVTADGEGVHAD